MKHRVLGFMIVLTAVACDESTTGSPDPMETIRDATRNYQQVDAALAAGYAPAGPCVSTPAGGMGIHYVNQSLVDGTVDPSRPEALLYAPTANGGRELVGVEFVVSAAAWDGTHSSPPTFAGQAFDDHRAPEARHGIPFAHYDLHVWAWRDNPNGRFTPFNPTVSCS